MCRFGGQGMIAGHGVAFALSDLPAAGGLLVGATTNPDGRWTTRQIRNLVMDLGDRVDGFRFMFRDRVGQFTASFDAVLADVGIETIRIPPRCPQRTATPSGSC
jgi:hypothetical protein